MKYVRKLIRYEGEVKEKYYTEYTFSYKGEQLTCYRIDNGILPYCENIVEQLRDKYHMDLYKKRPPSQGGGNKGPAS